MKGSEFFYYSMRCRKQRQMAQAARSEPASDAHRALALAYADRAALAMMDLEVGRSE